MWQKFKRRFITRCPSCGKHIRTGETAITEGLRAIYKLLQDNNRLLERVAKSLESALAQKEAPNYQLHLEEFATFNWASIGAFVERATKLIRT